MDMEKLFEAASRNKFRFSYKGSITTEDLWDLSLTALDSIYKDLNRKTKQNQEESLLEAKSKDNELLDMQIEIIKHIVAVKKQEATDKLLAKEHREKKQKIMEILAKRDDEALEKTSDEDLRKMLEELE